MKILSTYRTGFGEHISNACQNAVEQAKKRRKNVSFRFNGVFMVASPKRDPRKMVKAFHLILAREAKGPRLPAWVLQDREIEARKQSAREGVLKLTEALPAVLEQKSLDALMDWVRDFVKCGDWGDVDYTPVLEPLRAAGYGNSNWHNQDHDWYCTRERTGNYIINELVSQIEEVGSPHPMLISFCDEYFCQPHASL